MALRVLLADESSTIKKVIQLALQDFAVEVKSVPIGLDVLPVAKSFKPDLIFVDVLLTKRSGYEVCQDLKTDAATLNIPVILMWSGFMDIDEIKASSSGADRRLEKPFDADTLRSMVKDLVPKTLSNPIADFLSFPDMPEFDDSSVSPNDATLVSPLAAAHAGATQSAPESFSSSVQIPDDEEFLSLSDEADMPTMVAAPLTKPKEDNNPPEDSWSHQNLGKFKLDLPSENSAQEAGSFANKYVIPDDELIASGNGLTPEFDEMDFEMEETPDAPLPTRVGANPLYPAGETAIIKAREIEKDLSERTAIIPKAAPPKISDNKTSLGKPPSSSAARPSQQASARSGQISSQMMDSAETILREEVRAVLENIAWKVLPDVAERIVREEIKKLLQDVEKSI